VVSWWRICGELVVLNVVMKKCHDFRIYFFAEFGWGKSGSRVANNPPFA
jgi:hypothetical protein